MPVKGLKGRKDFSHLNYTEVADEVKPVKAEENTTNPQPYVYAYVKDADESTGQEVILFTESRPTVEVYLSATTPTTVHLDASVDGEWWIEDYATYNVGSPTKDGLVNAYPYLRLRSDPAGTSGTDKITMLIIATR